MNRIFATIIILLSAPVSVINAAESLNAELTKCATLTRDLQRLACYDLLSGKVSSFAEEALSTSANKALANQTSNPPVTDTAQNSFGKAEKNITPTNRFGLKEQSGSLDELHSTIPGEFSGWKKDDKITLANGQIWKIVDSQNRLYHKATNPEITISKGMLGSFRIRVNGINKSARVTRIK